MRKARLELDTLSVESFATTHPSPDERGTVRGFFVDEPEDDAAANNCTCVNSCPCPSAAYYCATVRHTAISCTYTQNASCIYNTTAQEI